MARVAAGLRAVRTETATGNDSLAAKPTKPASVAEVAAAQDATSSIPNYRATRNEIATASEALNTNFSVVARAVEIALAQMSATTNAAVFAQRAEVATGTVVEFGGLRYLVRRQENATIFDQPAGRRLWEPVPDTQDPNWVIIPTTPT
jgi:hypothetical protein